MTRDEQLDAAAAALSAAEPYFAPSYRAARALLRSAICGADVLKWANGATCQDGRCGCMGRTECLHEVSYKLYCYEERNDALTTARRAAPPV